MLTVEQKLAWYASQNAMLKKRIEFLEDKVDTQRKEMRIMDAMNKDYQQRFDELMETNDGKD